MNPQVYAWPSSKAKWRVVGVKFPKGFHLCNSTYSYILSHSCVAALHVDGKPSAPLLIHILILMGLTLNFICWMASWGLVFQAWDCKPSFGACNLGLGLLRRCFIYFAFRHFACDSGATSALEKVAREAAKLFDQSSPIQVLLLDTLLDFFKFFW